MIFSNIKIRLALIFCTIFLFSFSLIFYCTSNRFRNVLEKNIIEQNLQRTIALSGKIGDALKWGSWATIEVTLKKRFKQDPNWLFILIKDKDENTIVSTDNSLLEKKQASRLPKFNTSSSKRKLMALDPWEGINQLIHYQSTPLKSDIFHDQEIVAVAGEIIFDTYVEIIQDNELLGSIRTGFSRRELEDDVQYLQLVITCTGIVSLTLSILIVIPSIRNMLRPLTDLSRELSKISHIAHHNELLQQLQSIRIEDINVKTSELRTLKNASIRFKQQLIMNVEQAVKYSKLEIHARKMETIAETTQMLAHDVRKPFSMLKMLLQTFQDSQDPNEISALSKQFLPDVQKAITSVDGMIDDVMEIGRTTKPKQEPISPESVIEASLAEVCRIYQKADVDIVYEFNHKHMIYADALKLQRVFSNICSNAIQAMKYKGTLWITTNEDPDFSMTKFCIGNSGSHILKEDIPRLFDAFYTKEKPLGTGLGLAIAHKIVTAHGGEIWCETNKMKKKVYFNFTLPVAKGQINRTTAKLPKNTQKLITVFKATEKSANNQSIGIADPRLPIFEDKITAHRNNNRKLRIGVVDDEALYRNAMIELVRSSQTLRNAVDIAIFKDSDSAIKAFSTNTVPDLLICDLDLGPHSLNGFQLVKELRTQGCHQAVCIHSNRSLPEDYEKSVEVGAQAFLPKPMTREHLIKFIVNAISVEATKPNLEGA